MPMPLHRCLIAGAVLCVVAAGLTQRALAAGETATARMKLADGADAGVITLMEGTAGVLMKFELKGLKPGPHGMHVHESSACEGDFSSSGAIYNPLGAKHGYLHEEGPMAGDLPNIHVAADGTASGELLSPFLTLSKEAEETLFDSDGASIVIFEKPDDYVSDPEGNSGGRVACGAITAQ
ncbi:MAG TPA: superoxide dismutase family protein [Hyphomicrobium sp.]|nr:superoxide dismutase family protein [Hyphomicrobium sp.]